MVSGAGGGEWQYPYPGREWASSEARLEPLGLVWWSTSSNRLHLVKVLQALIQHQELKCVRLQGMFHILTITEGGLHPGWPGTHCMLGFWNCSPCPKHYWNIQNSCFSPLSMYSPVMVLSQESPTVHAQCLLCSVTCIVWFWPSSNSHGGCSMHSPSADKNYTLLGGHIMKHCCLGVVHCE